MKMIIGVCGDHCTDCPRFIATKSGKKSELEQVKELWGRLGLREYDFPVNEMACHGCLPDNPCAYAELRVCVSAHGYDNCGLCDAYPCQRINIVFERTEKLKAHAITVCTQEEMESLQNAFFSKKEYFDRLHQKRH